MVNYTHFVSPDGQSFVGLDSERNSVAYSVQAGEGKPVPGLNPAEVAFGWTGDGKSIYVYRPAVPALVYRVELNTEHRQLWIELNHPTWPGSTSSARPTSPPTARLTRTTTIASYPTSIWSMA